ncbi:MAG: serine--tRNA ligase [Minisyncoccales bacterium]|jgi:seryl-tRNA synthetase
MLDIKYIKNNPEAVKKGSKDKGVEVDIGLLLDLDEKRRELLQKIEEFRAQKNKANETIKSADDKEKEEIITKMKLVDLEEDKVQEEFKKVDGEFRKIMRSIPNIAFESVPVGKDDSENIVLREEGEKPNFEFEPKDYLDIAENLDIIDVKRAAKVSGSRFGYLKGDAVLMEFALVKLAIETAVQKGFVPVVPPVMIFPEMMEKMGHIEESDRAPERWKGEDVYFLKDDPLLLVGTSEQSIGPMHADEVFLKDELPKRYIGFSSCFRREAGSYGKDTKGILRVHQFDKIEMFSFCLPDKSKEEHQLLLSIEEDLMRKLGLPYRVIDICTGDLGMPAASKYDIEAWMPGQGQYRETHSTSNCTDFQSRRLNIRYRDKEGQNDFVHMLNGTAIAVGRILIAIIENYQREDGSVKVPDALVEYVGKKEIKR